MRARCIVGNSSTGIREAAFLGIPAVNIGSRQQGRERGPNVIDTRYDRKEIVDATSVQLAHGPYESDHIYGDGAAGPRIAECLAEAELTVEKRITY